MDTLHSLSYDTIQQVVNKITRHTVYDTVHNVVYDTTHVSLDSVASFGAFKNAYDIYNATYANMQTDMSNVIMIFTFIVAVLTLIFGGNFLWQNGAGLRFYNRYKVEMKKNMDDSILNFQKGLVSTYIQMGAQFYSSSQNKANRESLNQFYLALGHVLAFKYDDSFSFLYKSIVEGIEKNYCVADLIMMQNLSESLKKLSALVQKTNDNIYERIEQLRKNLEKDEDLDFEGRETFPGTKIPDSKPSFDEKVIDCDDENDLGKSERSNENDAPKEDPVENNQDEEDCGSQADSSVKNDSPKEDFVENNQDDEGRDSQADSSKKNDASKDESTEYEVDDSEAINKSDEK